MFWRISRFLALVLVPAAIVVGAASAEPYWTTYEDTEYCGCSVFGPFCLLAFKDGRTCSIFRARNQGEYERLKPDTDALRARSACKQRGEPGYLVAGVCLNVNLAEVREHQTLIAQKRTAARADCKSKNATLQSETTTWKGMYQYQCSGGGGGGEDDQILCEDGKCYDSDAVFGNECRSSPGCPGGANACGSPGCP